MEGTLPESEKIIVKEKKPLAPTSEGLKTELKPDKFKEFMIELPEKVKKFLKDLRELGGIITKNNIQNIRDRIKNMDTKKLKTTLTAMGLGGVGAFGITVFVVVVKIINEELEKRDEEREEK